MKTEAKKDALRKITIIVTICWYIIYSMVIFILAGDISYILTNGQEMGTLAYLIFGLLFAFGTIIFVMLIRIITKTS